MIISSLESIANLYLIKIFNAKQSFHTASKKYIITFYHDYAPFAVIIISSVRIYYTNV